MSEPNAAGDGIARPDAGERSLPMVIDGRHLVSRARPDDAAVERIIRRGVIWSMGAGIIPVMFVDTAALAVIQIRMVRDIARHYDVAFRRESVRSAVGVLLSSAAATAFGAGVLSSGVVRGLVQAIPLVGPAIGLATMPAFYAAFTYATGKVYQRHFASGGTFLNFDPEAVKDDFRATFEEKRRAV